MNREKLWKTVVYNQGLNTIDLVSVTGHFLLTFCAIFFDVPALIWYGWLQVLSELGMCEDGDDDTYGIWMQPQIGLLFYLSYYGAMALLLSPFRCWESFYLRRHGKNKGTCCVYTINQFRRFLHVNILGEMLALYAAAYLLTAVEEYFFIAVFGATLIAMLYLIYIKPKLSSNVKFEKLPADTEEGILEADLLAAFEK